MECIERMERVGRFLATVVATAELKIGRVAIGGGKEEETSYLVKSLLIFLDLPGAVANFHGRSVRDKRNVTNVG